MINPLDAVLWPWRAVRVLAQAAEDLNAVAERARQDPNPVEEARDRADSLLAELERLIAAVRAVDASALVLASRGEDLLLATQELIAGGKDLTGVAQDQADSLRVLRTALPRLLEGLDKMDQLEESVETVAQTVEPLQGVAKGVGRVSDRLSRESG